MVVSSKATGTQGAMSKASVCSARFKLECRTYDTFSSSKPLYQRLNAACATRLPPMQQRSRLLASCVHTAARLHCWKAWRCARIRCWLASKSAMRCVWCADAMRCCHCDQQLQRRRHCRRCIHALHTALLFQSCLICRHSQLTCKEAGGPLCHQQKVKEADSKHDVIDDGLEAHT